MSGTTSPTTIGAMSVAFSGSDCALTTAIDAEVINVAKVKKNASIITLFLSGLNKLLFCRFNENKNTTHQSELYYKNQKYYGIFPPYYIYLYIFLKFNGVNPVCLKKNL